MLAKGTLVQIKEEMVKGENFSNSYLFLAKRVAMDGYLWIIDGPAQDLHRHNPKEIWYWCRSVATGNLYDFKTEEFNTVTPRDWDYEADTHYYDRSNDQ